MQQLALRGQQGGHGARAFGQIGNVLRHQILQKIHSVGTANLQHAAIAQFGLKNTHASHVRFLRAFFKPIA